MTDTCDSKCVFAGQLNVLWKLGQGSHGEVLLVEDSASEEFGAKTASAGTFAVKLLEHEYKVYQHLQCHKKKILGLPQVFKYGFDHHHDKYVLVMSRLGASMRDVIELNRTPIPNYAALRIGSQLIRRLQYLHDMGLVHGDIKPRNILCGHETFEKVYFVDFGLATFYKNMKSGKHHHMVKGQKFKGTEDFASRNAHKGFSLSRRDDLESLGFSLIYMMRGSLPWSKSHAGGCGSWKGILENEEELADANFKSRSTAEAKEIKENISIEELCVGLPDCMSAYMRHVYSLAYDESPDYSFLINKMETNMDFLKRTGEENNGSELIIWTVPFERSRYMRIKLEKEVWEEFEVENENGEEKNTTEPIQESVEMQRGAGANEQPVPDGKDFVHCDPLCWMRACKRIGTSSKEESKQGSEVSTVRPHPTLSERSQKWWANLLVFFRIQKPTPESLVLL